MISNLLDKQAMAWGGNHWFMISKLYHVQRTRPMRKHTRKLGVFDEDIKVKTEQTLFKKGTSRTTASINPLCRVMKHLQQALLISMIICVAQIQSTRKDKSTTKRTSRGHSQVNIMQKLYRTGKPQD